MNNHTNVVAINHQSYVNKKDHFILDKSFSFFDHQEKTTYYRLPFVNSLKQTLLTISCCFFDWFVFLFTCCKCKQYFHLNDLLIFLIIIKFFQIGYYVMYYFKQANNPFYYICEYFKQLGQQTYNYFLGRFTSPYQITTTLTINLLTIAVPIVLVIIMLGSFIYHYYDDNYVGNDHENSIYAWIHA